MMDSKAPKKYYQYKSRNKSQEKFARKFPYRYSTPRPLGPSPGSLRSPPSSMSGVHGLELGEGFSSLGIL